MNKTSLKKARDKNVRVTFCEDGQSWDMSKDVIIWKLLEVEFVNPAQGAALTQTGSREGQFMTSSG